MAIRWLAIGMMAGGALGFVVGWMAHPSEDEVDAGAITEVEVEHTELGTGEHFAAPRPASRRLTASEAGATARRTPQGARSLANPAQLEMEELRGQLETLRRELDSLEQQRLANEGKAVPKPDSLAERFESDALRSSLTAAFDELGFDAEVTAVDCTEHPCILYGEGFGSREDSDRLRDSAAMAAYGKDWRSVWGWRMRGAGQSEQQRYFAVAIYPHLKGEEEREAVRKRIEWRTEQMRETLTLR